MSILDAGKSLFAEVMSIPIVFAEVHVDCARYGYLTLYDFFDKYLTTVV